jgi:hypothetical protein
VDEAKSRQSVDWQQYFYSIKQQCPWSLASWQRGLIDIQTWQGQVQDLGEYDARVYVVNMPNEELEKLCEELDHGVSEWLFSYPGYGQWATPVPVLIQQDRQQLARIRQKLQSDNK